MTVKGREKAIEKAKEKLAKQEAKLAAEKAEKERKAAEREAKMKDKAKKIAPKYRELIGRVKYAIFMDGRNPGFQFAWGFKVGDVQVTRDPLRDNFVTVTVGTEKLSWDPGEAVDGIIGAVKALTE